MNAGQPVSFPVIPQAENFGRIVPGTDCGIAVSIQIGKSTGQKPRKNWVDLWITERCETVSAFLPFPKGEEAEVVVYTQL